MEINIVKNRYINSLLLLMLFSAIIHMAILIVFSVAFSNVHLLNYFNILNLNYLFPEFSNDVWADIISFVVMLGLYLLILKFNKPAK